MSEESSFPRDGRIRRLREPEKELLRCLLKQADDSSVRLSNFDDLNVQEMPDGSMGSLLFVDRAKEGHKRHFGQRVAEFQFNDVDGVAIIASLNVDTEGDLLELDIWKTDFKPVIQLNPKQTSCDDVNQEPEKGA